jgi:hypothetical protein
MLGGFSDRSPAFFVSSLLKAQAGRRVFCGLWAAMSALGHKQTSRHVRFMSGLPPKADIARLDCHVCFVPIADIEGVGSPSEALLIRKTDRGSREYSSVSTGWSANGKYEFKTGAAGVGF